MKNFDDQYFYSVEKGGLNKYIDKMNGKNEDPVIYIGVFNADENENFEIILKIVDSDFSDDNDYTVTIIIYSIVIVLVLIVICVYVIISLANKKDAKAH